VSHILFLILEYILHVRIPVAPDLTESTVYFETIISACTVDNIQIYWKLIEKTANLRSCELMITQTCRPLFLNMITSEFIGALLWLLAQHP
jgi:hypothetical protein